MYKTINENQYKANGNVIESDLLSLSVLIYRGLRKDVIFCVNTFQQGF